MKQYLVEQGIRDALCAVKRKYVINGMVCHTYGSPVVANTRNLARVVKFLRSFNPALLDFTTCDILTLGFHIQVGDILTIDVDKNKEGRFTVPRITWSNYEIQN